MRHKGERFIAAYYGDSFRLNGDSFRFFIGWIQQDAFAVLLGRHAGKAFKELCKIGGIIRQPYSNLRNGAGRVLQLLFGQVHDLCFKIVAGGMTGCQVNGIAKVGGMNEEQRGKIPDLQHIRCLPRYDICQVLIQRLQEISRDLLLPGKDFLREAFGHNDHKSKDRNGADRKE